MRPEATPNFNSWFIQQFGKRENHTDPNDEELKAITRDGENARRTLAIRERWDANYTAALYAWQASQK